MVTYLSWFLLHLLAQVIASVLSPTSTAALGYLTLPSNNGGQSSNNPHIANVSDFVYLPYRFHVPNTQTNLRLGFGFRRRSFDPVEMGSLIAVAEDFVDQRIEELGRDVLYPPTGTGMQEFIYDIGDGISLLIWNVKVGMYWTWGTLKDVIEGLRLYLIVGERFRRTYFNFGYVPHVLPYERRKLREYLRTRALTSLSELEMNWSGRSLELVASYDQEIPSVPNGSEAAGSAMLAH